MKPNPANSVNYWERYAMSLQVKPVGENPPAKIAPGLADIPVNKILSQLQYLEFRLLPRIEQKSGKENADYKFFYEVFRSLLYMLIVLDRHTYLQTQFGWTNQLLKFYKERYERAERELQKYNAAEDLLFSECMEHVLKGAATRANDLLNAKK